MHTGNRSVVTKRATDCLKTEDYPTVNIRHLLGKLVYILTYYGYLFLSENFMDIHCCRKPNCQQ